MSHISPETNDQAGSTLWHRHTPCSETTKPTGIYHLTCKGNRIKWQIFVWRDAFMSNITLRGTVLTAIMMHGSQLRARCLADSERSRCFMTGMSLLCVPPWIIFNSLHTSSIIILLLACVAHSIAAPLFVHSPDVSPQSSEINSKVGQAADTPDTIKSPVAAEHFISLCDKLNKAD